MVERSNGGVGGEGEGLVRGVEWGSGGVGKRGRMGEWGEGGKRGRMGEDGGVLKNK